MTGKFEGGKHKRMRKEMSVSNDRMRVREWEGIMKVSKERIRARDE